MVVMAVLEVAARGGQRSWVCSYFFSISGGSLMLPLISMLPAMSGSRSVCSCSVDTPRLNPVTDFEYLALQVGIREATASLWPLASMENSSLTTVAPLGPFHSIARLAMLE